MALDSVSELAKNLGNMSSNQDILEQNLSPDEADALFNRAENEQIIVTGSVRMVKKPFKTSAFIIGHPVQGDLDNSLYILDEGYADSTPGYFGFPVTFPVTFAGGTTATEIIFETEF